MRAGYNYQQNQLTQQQIALGQAGQAAGDTFAGLANTASWLLAPNATAQQRQGWLDFGSAGGGLLVSFTGQSSGGPLAILNVDQPSVYGVDAAAEEGAKGGSLRSQYMGATPDKYSATGAAVVERMRSDGLIVGDGPLLRGNPNGLQLITGDTLLNIDSNVDMAHITDAVTWWNEIGRFFGAKSPEVREFMLNPNNYVLRQSSINRSEGGAVSGKLTCRLLRRASLYRRGRM